VLLATHASNQVIRGEPFEAMAVAGPPSVDAVPYRDFMVLQPEDVIQILAAHAPVLREQGVRSLILFGSIARREARADSDVDLVVEFDHPVGYFALFRLQDQLADWLGRPVDLATAESLRPELRQRVQSEGLRAA
jgi:uncharacterized protein